MSRFSNGNPPRSKITGSRFINEDDRSIIMTGSSDGIIRLFANYESQEGVFMTSSFRALTDLVPSTHNAGLVFEWLQGRGQTLVAGDAKVIRVWNAEMEICMRVSLIGRIMAKLSPPLAHTTSFRTSPPVLVPA